MTFINPEWSVVVAAVSGKAHTRARRGSQDAFCVRRGVGVGGAGFVVAVVCDGCSAGGSSEVGAGLGARFVAAELARRVVAGAVVDDALAVAVKDAVVAELGRVAAALAVEGAVDGEDVRNVIADSLLFTLQAAVVVDGGGYLCFGVGDGVVRVDGCDVEVGGNDDGCPDCVAYTLLDDLRGHARLRVHAQGSSSTLRSLTIASDGALELRAHGVVGGFEIDPVFVANPSLATKRIAALGAAAPEDDCTVVVLRKDGVACA